MLILMQGWPGSGKSTKAKEIAKDIPDCVIYSTDEYHYKDGVYVFQPEKLGLFHQLNFERTAKALQLGLTVIVDNTNIKRKDIRKYIQVAEHLDLPIKVVRCEGNFQNTHGVPQEVVDRMKREIEDISDVET